MAASVKPASILETPPIPAEFIIQFQGKPYITANGLIYLGHLQNLKRVDCQLVQAGNQANGQTTIMRCEVETDLGVFCDYGEVGPANSRGVAGAYPVSMAATRARNRALRIATKCPMTSYEEMGMDEDEAAQRATSRRQTPAHAPNHDTGEVPAAPADLAVRLYGRLVEAAREAGETMLPLDANWSRQELDDLLNGAIAFLVEHHEGLNHAPATADQQIKLSTACSLYQQRGVGLVTPPALTEGGVAWLLPVLKTCLAPGKAKPAPVAEDASEAAELAALGV